MGLFSSLFSGFNTLKEATTLVDQVVAALATEGIQLEMLPSAAQKGVMNIVYRHNHLGNADVQHIAGEARLWLVGEGYV